jgi:hypothetical protein
MATDGIGVETLIQGGGDTRVVAVKIDHVRSRAAPGEVHRWRLSSYGWASEKSVGVRLYLDDVGIGAGTVAVICP